MSKRLISFSLACLPVTETKCSAAMSHMLKGLAGEIMVSNEHVCTSRERMMHTR